MLNVYVIGDVLIDAATRFDEGRIMRQLQGREITAHALTHAHPDHLGASHAVCERLRIPFWVGANDADAAEDPQKLRESLVHLSFPGGAQVVRAYVALQVTDGHPVERRLVEGDEVAGFRVLDVPGHSPGHIAFWRESDRVLIAGDVLWNFQFAMGRPGLTEPAKPANTDSAMNRDSARRLAALEPELVCFGHGPPLRDGRRFREVVARLPR
jgi:glyoxylase-like metal-dependent hydrolase (beta-lactamase superfamily II)